MFLASADLPPRPDSTSGEPWPPHAPGFNKPDKPKNHSDRASDPSDMPPPPDGQGPVLAWYKSSKRGALFVAAGMFSLITLGGALYAVFVYGFDARWMTAWQLLLIPLVIAFLAYGSQRITEVSTGADWLQSRSGAWARARAWVRIYELVKVTAHYRSNAVHLDFKDRDGRVVQISSSDIQEDRDMWDLVYNGILHSVIAGRATTNGALHSAFDIPRPHPE